MSARATASAREAALEAAARRGVPIALAVIGAWALVLAVALWCSARFAADALWVAIAFLPLRTLSSTGLFITAHDAMHGLVAPRARRLNDAIGALCLALFAFLPYARMREAHHVHHRVPARAGDPDFVDAGFVRWFVGFFLGYVSLPILALNGALYVALFFAGVPLVVLVLVLGLPGLLSALQLFLFGTWLPHRAGPGHDDDHRARSSPYPPWLSFITCFHFGYHWEHHEEPWAPWWMLPARRALTVAQRRAALAHS